MRMGPLKLLGFAGLLMIAWTLINIPYPGISAWFDHRLSILFPDTFTFEGWPDWIQAIASTATLLLPLLGLSAVPDPRAVLDVQFTTRRFNAVGKSHIWQINLTARRDVTDELHLHIYPQGSGNEITLLQIVHADGGVASSGRIDELRDGHIIIKRMPARSKLSLSLTTKKKDTLSAMAVKARINKRSIYEKINKRGELGVATLNLVTIAHTRLILLAIIFSIYAIIIIGRLAWIGFQL